VTQTEKAMKYVGELPELYKYMPQLSIEERNRRWRIIRELMLARQLDCLLVWGSDAWSNLSGPNFQYITSFPCFGQCLVLFPLQGDPIAYVGQSQMPFYYNVTYTWVKDVRPAASANDIIKIVKELGLEKSNIGIVEFTRHPVLLYSLWREVLGGLPEVNFVDESGMFDILRIFKSPEEIKCMEEAARIAKLAYQALLETAKPGVTECEIYANMEHAMISNGAGHINMILIGSTTPNFGHPRYPPPTMRKLEKSDIFMTEYHTSYAGYIVHTERSVSIGKPRKEYTELFKVCLESHNRSMDKLKPGKSLKEAIEAARSPICEAGMDWIECGFHLHGLESGGFPSSGGTSGAALEKIAPFEIRENMIFASVINIYNPSWPKGGGVTLGNTVLVTKQGNRILQDIPLELAVA
jgi:Xaa-Pro aminopeptidase